jgi:Na+/H+ antiporter NhaD/arsenite permease-like protein
MTVLGALYIISGGIFVSGSLSGTPLSNTAILGIGAILANLIGTTGASMVLIRPLLRANQSRVRRVHLIVFFIFIVSNSGGLLTPLGDPPLFLGYLRGVPFFWTLGLWKEWLVMNAALLIAFNFFDEYVLDREEKERPGSQYVEVQEAARPIHIQGFVNVLLLVGVLLAVLLLQPFLKILTLWGLSIASLILTPRGLRAENRYTWDPILEVAILFAGIFATMVPALMLLQHHASSLPIREPWHYFWATGLLSSFLDNAPTYLSFASAASGQAGTNPDHLKELIGAQIRMGDAVLAGEAVLAAIAVGAVFMGANTYIGNGPNFMVKAIAEQAGIRMPSFVGYMKWSGAILIPLFVLLTLLFFRG